MLGWLGSTWSLFFLSRKLPAYYIELSAFSVKLLVFWIIYAGNFTENSTNFVENAGNFAQNVSNSIQYAGNFAENADNFTENASNFAENTDKFVENASNSI